MSYGWAPYVPVAKRQAKAKKKMAQLQKKGMKIQPIEKTGNKIAKTFWGRAWCDHLENFSDYDNRLPRGRTYVRNGSVCHLEINKGQIKAMVSGSDIYNIQVEIKPLPKAQWLAIRKKCAGGIGSLLELLQGKLSDNVMKAVTNSNQGLFPQSNEIKMKCDCPDWATMCKHAAAVLYGIGARLDQSPELLFLLRDVDHLDLIEADVKIPVDSRRKNRVTGDLADIFGIDLEEPAILTQGSLTPEPLKKKSKVKAVVRAKAASNLKLRSDPKTEKTSPKAKINISKGISAANVKQLRQRLSLSEAEFAQSIGKKQTTIRNWESKSGLLRLQWSSREALKKAFEDYNNG